MTRRFSVICLSLVCLAAVGCDAPRPTTRTFGYLHLPHTTQPQAFEAATRALSEHFRLDTVDPAAGIITNLPEETIEIVSGGRMSDAVGVPRRVRRVATVWVTGSEKSADVWCKVVFEASETQSQTLFERERSPDDTPTATAVDRGSAATPEQNAYWRVLRREKPLERAILRAVEEIVLRNQEGGEPD